MPKIILGLKNRKKRRAAWKSLTSGWDADRWSRYWRGGRVTKAEKQTFRTLLRPDEVPVASENPADTVRVQPSTVSEDAVQSSDATVKADDSQSPASEVVSTLAEETEAMILTDENSGSGSGETTEGGVLNDAFDDLKKSGKKKGKKAASNYFNRLMGSIFGDDDDRPAWQKYGWSGQGDFASQVSEGNDVTDRSRRILLTGYVDAQGTKAWVGKRLLNRRTGRKTGKVGTARELYDARMEAIRKGIIQESAITDPSFEYGHFRDIGVDDIPASSAEPTVTTGIGDDLVVPDDDDLRDQIIGMFQDMYGPGADDGSAGGGMSDTNTVGAGVEPTPKMPVGVSMTGIGLIAVALVGLVFIMRR